MALGGTLEQLPQPIVIDNGFGGTDTLTHRAFGMNIDPFSSMAMIMVTVTMYTGKPVGGKAFKTYPGIPPQTCQITEEEMKQLVQSNKYSFQGFVDLAKQKLGVT